MADEYLEQAPDWYAEWVRDVHAAGGVASRVPPGALPVAGFDAGGFPYVGDNAGELGEKYPVLQDDGTRGFAWKLAPLTVRLHDNWDRLVADSLLTFEADDEDFVNFATNVATLPAKAAGKAATTVPWWVWLIVAGVSYGALVQIGVVPPINKLLGSRRSSE